MERHAQRVDIPDLLRMIRAFNPAAAETRSSWQPSLPLEIALVESISKDQPEAETAPTGKQVAQARPKNAAPPLQVQGNQHPSPSTPESTETSAGEPQSETATLLKSIHEKWRQVLAQVRRQSRPTEALLNSGRLLGIKDGVLYFGIPSEVLKSKIEKRENIEVIQQALKDVLQTELPFRCVVSGGKSGGIPPDVDGEGMVASALRDLGGEIVDVQ
jgi:DNA polymerase-3 subunit gamma/tau